MACMLSNSKHKRASTLLCTQPSTEKRDRRPAQPAAPEPDWSSLSPDLVRRVGDRILAADDIDHYMAFRAVCHNWRRALKDDDDHPDYRADDDPTRLQPSKWAVLDRRDDALSLVNLETGRFLRKRIPLLRDHLFVGATGGGLVVLAEPTYPYRARVLNPFTGALARYKAPVPAAETREVAVITTSSPARMTLFVSMLADGAVVWADQESERFQNCAAPDDYPDYLMCMVPFAGDVHLTDRQGSVLSISTAAAAGVEDDGASQGRSAQSISMASVVVPALGPAAVEGGRCHYLVESGGELLLVTRRWYGMLPELAAVHRVDTVRNVLAPVTTIGNRALFLSRIRCLSVDADKFPAVEGGCIYFVDQFVTYFDVQCSFMTVVRFPVGVPAQQPLLEISPIPADCFRPFTLTHVFANYCKFVQYSEILRQIIVNGEEDYFSDDDDDEDYLSDDDYESDQ